MVRMNSDDAHRLRWRRCGGDQWPFSQSREMTEELDWLHTVWTFTQFGLETARWDWMRVCTGFKTPVLIQDYLKGDMHAPDTISLNSGMSHTCHTHVTKWMHFWKNGLWPSPLPLFWENMMHIFRKYSLICVNLQWKSSEFFWKLIHFGKRRLP